MGSFQQLPTFGPDTIRRFLNNVSELKRLAARDFEDLLQVSYNLETAQASADIGSLKCTIPAFEGLLPEPHNSNILRLLFVCAHWHGLAKLCMHTDQTLKIMDDMAKIGCLQKYQDYYWT
jgi:hypothetical protein